MKKAVILLSGSLDSATCLAIAKKKGFLCYALSLKFGQKHNVELIAAKNIASYFNFVQYVKLPIREFRRFCTHRRLNRPACLNRR